MVRRFYPPHRSYFVQLASLLNCDLAILAYQLYHQATVWPLDPWYEILAHPLSNRRTATLSAIHQNLAALVHIDAVGHYSGPAAPMALG